MISLMGRGGEGEGVSEHVRKTVSKGGRGRRCVGLPWVAFEIGKLCMTIDAQPKVIKLVG